MLPRTPRSRAVAGYLLGHGLILLGAAAIGWTDSVLPLALCGSAALMLNVPLLRRIAARRRRV